MHAILHPEHRDSAISEEQCEFYHENGFLVVKQGFNKEEINYLKQAAEEVIAAHLPGQVNENNGGAVRSINGVHLKHKVLADLCRLPRLLLPCAHILDSDDLYVHQSKINTKVAFIGDVWEWHQDYIFWQKEDGMPRPQAINAVVYLDDVTEFNAPIMVIPGSHKEGTVDVAAVLNEDIPEDAPDWLSNTTAKLKYGAQPDVIKKLVAKKGLFSTRGERGTILFFDCNLFHASSVNMSPFDRKVIIISYNRVDNQLNPVAKPRPDFLANRDYTPLRPLQADKLK